MAEHVESIGRHHQRRHCGQCSGIENAERRAQFAMGNAGLHLHFQNVEDSHAGAFTGGAERGGAGNVRFQRARNGLSLADWKVHIGEQVRRIGGVEIARLGGIHD